MRKRRRPKEEDEMGRREKPEAQRQQGRTRMMPRRMERRKQSGKFYWSKTNLFY
jgi:hypothetical protein